MSSRVEPVARDLLTELFSQPMISSDVHEKRGASLGSVLYFLITQSHIKTRLKNTKIVTCLGRIVLS